MGTYSSSVDCPDNILPTMEKAGREVENYRGRNFYNGPAVRVDESELQGVIRKTRVKIQWDTMGKTGIIIYPR